MAWFILARLAFMCAVAYSAFMLRPLGIDPVINVSFGVGLAVVSVVFEWQLRNTAVTHMLGAFIGGAGGLLLAKGISAALFWIDHGDQRVAFLHSFILQKIQKMSGVAVVISDVDFPEIKEVDLKLIELARSLSGKIVTNDFNLNKVAQLRGVDVLNINELANSLKPVVLPGEMMKVFILKEGKEYNQGVAYLDDGTMVVVDNARRMISKNIDIVVTSVLQTTAGKMIFGRFIEAGMPAAAAGAQITAPDRIDRPERARATVPAAAPVQTQT